MVTTDGNKVEFAEGENFTITAMRGKDGSSISSAETTEYVYKTANSTELMEMQQQLTALRQEIEEREPTGGAGGSGGTSPNTIMLILAAAAAVAIGIGSQNGGGRRGRRRR